VLHYKSDWPLFYSLDVLYFYFNLLSTGCNCIGVFWFGRYVVFDSFVAVRCSMYCDIIVLILS